jgi:hypothetical protein
VVIQNSTLGNNFAASTCGGFSDDNNGFGIGTLAVSNCLFVNNSAGGKLAPSLRPRGMMTA